MSAEGFELYELPEDEALVQVVALEVEKAADDAFDGSALGG